MAEQPDVEILDSGVWAPVVKEADVDPGWLRFHWLNGQVGLAMPAKWRPIIRNQGLQNDKT